MRHVPIETLAEHAAGHVDLALRVLIEAHLDLCAECRAEQASLVAPGGRLLAESVPAAPPPELWSRIEAATISTAHSPCTRESTTVSRKPIPLRASSSWKSCQAAVPALDTTPTRRGTWLSGRRRLASTEPSATRRRKT